MALELADQLLIADILRCAKSAELISQAFRHRSWVNEQGNGSQTDNEKLEFLGDSVLGLVVADYLFTSYSGFSEGQLSKAKSVIVSAPILSCIARKIDLAPHLILGKGEEKNGGRSRDSNLADALEALIGAVYLDSGYEAAQRFVLRVIVPEINSLAKEGFSTDYKSQIQEVSQKLFGLPPRYKLLRTTGPDHQKVFSVEVEIHAVSYGPGQGKSKKEAEQVAAKAALLALAPLR